MGQAQFTNADLDIFTDRVAIGVALGFPPGKVFYVNSATGSANNTGLSSGSPFAALSTAVARCSANAGDVILVAAGHTETTGTTAYSLNVAGITIIGQGNGRSRPAFTANASAVDAFNVSAANVTIRNCRFIGATSCTALINIAAADCTILNCVFEHGAAPTDAITVPASSHRFRIEGCQFLGTAAGPDAGITVEGVCNDFVIRNNLFQYSVSVGLDEAGVDLGSNACLGFVIDGNVFVGMDLTMIDMNTSTSATAGDGIAMRNYGTGYSAVANIDTAIDAGGMGSCENFFTDLAAEAAGRVPVTTPA